MKKLLLLLSLSILCLFSSLSWSAETGVEAGQQKADSELNFPDYSPLGRRIANGEPVYADVFYWIKADGTIGTTKRGWSRVPKPRRHLVYLDRNIAEQAVQDASKSPEEKAKIKKEREAPKGFLVPNCLKKGLRNLQCDTCTNSEFTYPVCKMDSCSDGSGTTTTTCRGSGSFAEIHRSCATWYFDRIDDGLGSCKGYVWGSRNKYVPNGDQYVGEFKKGKQHGQGTYTWTGGDQYVGGTKEGKQHGQGTYTWASGSKYIGQWRDGERHGIGTNTRADGTIEKGFWTQGLFLYAYTESVCPGSYSSFSWHNCAAMRTWPNGRDYIGEFQNGRAHGSGVSSWSNKFEIYLGEWKNGKRHGQGEITWVDGKKVHIYSGEYKEDKKHGQGTYTWGSDKKYVGQWKDGKRHGQGTYTWGKGNKYVGQWKNNKANGQGTETYNDGRKYVGEFKDHHIHLGTLTWADGRKYIGEFKDYKSHGIGNFYRTDGSMMGGMWAKDEPVEGYAGGSCSGDSATWSDCIGTLTLADGTQFIGKFLDGKTFGKGTLIFPDNRPMQFAVELKDQDVSSSTGPAIGDTVKTKYFDVTVNSVWTSYNIGHEFLETEWGNAGLGNTFLEIDVTYKNTDTEARYLMSGEVMVRIGDKELRYDTAEAVFADGYIIFDSLNPGVTLRDKVVFKIPEGLEGEIFYKPARSSELIKLN